MRGALLRRLATGFAATSVLTLGAASPVVTTTAAAAPAKARLTTAADCRHIEGATSATAGGRHDPDTLGAPAVQARERDLARRLAATQAAGRRLAAGSVTVDVYVHVITSSSGAGNLSSATIAAQLGALNRAYAGRASSAAAATPFRFRRVATDRTANDYWYTMGQGSRAEHSAKVVLHRGDASDLNVYFANIGAQGLLGWATFPGGRLSQDGVVINKNTVPGGAQKNYNQGDTATHEVGHWLGLYHTFQGGCHSPNDHVRDTPAQSGPTSGCPVRRNSCRLPGLDPIHNYMDYSYDRCMNRFTRGQSSRMASIWTAYRA